MTARSRRILLLILFAYLALVLVIVLTPSGNAPLDSLVVRVLRRLYTVGLPTFVDFSVVEWLANVAMFVPLGVLLVLVLPRRWWWTAPIGLGFASVSIELFQGLFLPLRYAMVNDVIANTLGGVAGALLGLLILRAAVRDRASSADVTVKP